MIAILYEILKNTAMLGEQVITWKRWDRFLSYTGFEALWCEDANYQSLSFPFAVEGRVRFSLTRGLFGVKADSVPFHWVGMNNPHR